MSNKQEAQNSPYSRRQFVRSASAVGLALAGGRHVFAAGGETIRVGLVGCGGRGTGAAVDCMIASRDVKIVAMGDLFKDQLDASFERIQAKNKKNAKQFAVTPETCFTGFDAYRKVLAADVDLVILATPPAFRPMMMEAAIRAGKHVFAEKPVAVDPAGVRSVIATAELAKEKNLAIVAGTQRRHCNHYIEIMKRIHDGEIGELTGGQCYWNGGELWSKPRRPEWSDTEYQIRNWLYYTWLSGDHIVEQHVHNIDVMNWAFGAVPESCMAMGGRAARTAPEFGNVYDHFSVEFKYPSGARVQSMCRQTRGAARRVAEQMVGTEGSVVLDMRTGKISGKNPFEPDASPNPKVAEHFDLIQSIKSGKPLNEGKRVAESTLCAIMGRMSAYTGRELNFNWALNASKLDLMPKDLAFSKMLTEPVAIPGITPLI